MHDGMPYGRNQGQGQVHSREVDRQYPTELIFYIRIRVGVRYRVRLSVLGYRYTTAPQQTKEVHSKRQ